MPADQWLCSPFPEERIMVAADESRLDDKEMERLDALLSAARSFHYMNFIVAAIALALSSIERTEAFQLPIGGLAIPPTETAVGAYILSICLAVASASLFRQAEPWMKKDPRRPPFAWIALGAADPNRGKVFLWVLVPVILTSVAVSMTLDQKVPHSGLLLPGFFLVGFPLIFEHYFSLIRTRTDHRGGSAPFSIWLLYCYRLMRQLLLVGAFLFPVLAAVRQWRGPMLTASAICFSAVVSLMLLRLAGGFTYRWIDKFGGRFGFPTHSQHYD